MYIYTIPSNIHAYIPFNSSMNNWNIDFFHSVSMHPFCKRLVLVQLSWCHRDHVSQNCSRANVDQLVRCYCNQNLRAAYKHLDRGLWDSEKIDKSVEEKLYINSKRFVNFLYIATYPTVSYSCCSNCL